MPVWDCWDHVQAQGSVIPLGPFQLRTFHGSVIYDLPLPLGSLGCRVPHPKSQILPRSSSPPQPPPALSCTHSWQELSLPLTLTVTSSFGNLIPDQQSMAWLQKPPGIPAIPWPTLGKAALFPENRDRNKIPEGREGEQKLRDSGRTSRGQRGAPGAAALPTGISLFQVQVSLCLTGISLFQAHLSLCSEKEAAACAVSVLANAPWEYPRPWSRGGAGEKQQICWFRTFSADFGVRGLGMVWEGVLCVSPAQSFTSTGRRRGNPGIYLSSRDPHKGLNPWNRRAKAVPGTLPGSRADAATPSLGFTSCSGCKTRSWLCPD